MKIISLNLMQRNNIVSTKRRTMMRGKKKTNKQTIQSESQRTYSPNLANEMKPPPKKEKLYSFKIYIN